MLPYVSLCMYSYPMCFCTVETKSGIPQGRDYLSDTAVLPNWLPIYIPAHKGEHQFFHTHAINYCFKHFIPLKNEKLSFFHIFIWMSQITSGNKNMFMFIAHWGFLKVNSLLAVFGHFYIELFDLWTLLIYSAEGHWVCYMLPISRPPPNLSINLLKFCKGT